MSSDTCIDTDVLRDSVHRDRTMYVICKACAMRNRQDPSDIQCCIALPEARGATLKRDIKVAWKVEEEHAVQLGNDKAFERNSCI
jgi:hypothetical protein